MPLCGKTRTRRPHPEKSQLPAGNQWPETIAPAEPGLPGISSAPEGENQKLREQILNALRADSSLASSSFNVEVSGSQIVLSGSVPTAREKETARRIAQSYGNNRSVGATKIDVRNAGRAEETLAPGR